MLQNNFLLKYVLAVNPRKDYSKLSERQIMSLYDYTLAKGIHAQPCAT